MMPGALAKRWKSLPRATKWIVIAALATGAYFAIEPVLDARMLAASRADEAAEQLHQFSQRSRQFQQAQQDIGRGTTQFGDVEMPGAGTNVVSTASNKIREALSDRGITEWNIQTRRGVPLGRGVLGELLEGDDQEIQRVTFDVQLTDTPEVVTAVLAEIERMPEVTTIGSVEIRKSGGDGRKVQARLTPETWIIVRREERR
jgi:hypothetical protein